jgi:CBS domain-containing protein
MVSISADTTLRRALDMVLDMQVVSGTGAHSYSHRVVAVVDKGDIYGVLEVDKLLTWSESA